MSDERLAASSGQACGRDPLVDAITMFLAREHAASLDEIREHLERAIDEAGPEALQALSDRLAHGADEWNYYPRDPLARRIHHALAAPVLRQDPTLLGTEHLASVAEQPLLIMANHLSYSDANVIEFVLQQCGAGRVADRLTVIAGPKVYSSLRRRFSSLCFGTIKVPQSAARSSGEAVMTTREVAMAARQSLQVAEERLRAGEALLVFAEGNRSRSAELQPFLPGVARYLSTPDIWLLPVGIAGTERLFPMEADRLHSVRLRVHFGRPVLARRLVDRARHERRLIVDAIGVAIAKLLPEAYRGAYGEAAADLERARQVYADVWQ
jgi:1-acyl-sn-glycerol-3-phosphate acyltransferase